MKLTKRNIIILLCLVCLLFSFMGVYGLTKAEGNEIRYSKKAVSVMFDNSGSMNGDHHKFEYALYSMQMLMALLNEGDTLVITPMNTYSAVQVDLSATDRNAEIQRIIGIMETMTSPLGTPHAPIGDAVNELVGQGLKTKENLLDEPENIDYWLIVLTDGAFNNYKGKADEAVEQYIDKYPSLNTIYLGFVDADDLSNSSITNKYKFTPYLAKDPDSITDVMTSVSNQMSGRYAFDSSVYSISGNKLTIDLDKCAFSLKSLSVVTQNCDAVISSAKYNGVSVGTKLPCVISPSTVLGMKSGYSATIEGNPYLSGGKLEIEYSAPIDQVSILAEPALKMEAVLDRLDGSDWVPTDIQYINANLKPGAVIRVGYKVFEQANSSLIDLEKVFGTATTKVTYAGNSYQCGDRITLVKGVNEIGTSVSVMAGTYTMYSTLTCVVEDNPTDYRIEAEYSGRLDVGAKTLKSKYIVYYDDKPLTKAQFAEFTIEAKTTDSFGKESPTQYVIENDGKVSVTTTFNKLEYDVFTEYFKVTSSKKIYRDFKTETGYYPSAFSVDVTEGDSLSMSEHQLLSNLSSVTFELSADGKPMAFTNKIVEYKVEFDGVDVTEYAMVDQNYLTYTPKAEHLGKTSGLVGTKNIVVSVNAFKNTSIKAQAQSSMNVTSTVYNVESLSTTNKVVDRFAIDDSNAEVLFKITRDGVALTQEELTKALEQGQIAVTDDGTCSSFVWLPCGNNVSVKTVDGVALISYKVVGDMFQPLQSFMAMLIFNGDKAVTLSYMGSSCTDHVTFNPSPAWEYIWRILVILLIIHTILFIVGFFKAKSFPAGTFVKITLFGDSDEISVKRTCYNFKFTEKWLWHYKRFLFIKPYFGNQSGTRITPIEIFYKDNREKMKFKKDVRALRYNKSTNEAGKLFDEYLRVFKSKNYQGSNPKKPHVLSGDVKGMFKPSGKIFIPKGQDVGLSETPYGIFDEDLNLKSILIFVRKRK